MRRNALTWLCLLFIAFQLGSAQIPRTISYQGVLTDVNGTAVTDGAYEMTFRLYDALDGGTALWSETQTVPVQDGLFNVLLGTVTPLTPAFDRPYWLGVTVGSGQEMVPRIPLAASAYSLNAHTVRDSAITSAKIADGQVVRSLNGLTDAVTLAAGNNVSLSQSGNTITIAASPSAEGGNTLDQAYDQGGAGAGRQITADAGAVSIDGPDGLRVKGSVVIGDSQADEKLVVKETDSLGTEDGFTAVRLHMVRDVADNVSLRNTRALVVSSDYIAAAGTYYAPKAIQAMIRNYSDAGTVTEASGLYSLVKNFSTGTIEIANGLYAVVSNHNSGKIQNVRGVFVASPRNYTGTMENIYGVLIENQKVEGANSYAIFAQGGKSYFADSVGIGTTQPRGHLHLSSNGDTKLRFTNGKGNDVAIVYNTDNDALEFRLGKTGMDTKVVITDDGKVGIGHSNPPNILTIEQGSLTDPIADGWTTYSSRRWKTNVRPIEKALQIVMQLRGVRFDWKSSGKHDIGLIAEEVGRVIPEIVTYEENGDDARSVDYARLVAVLIQAIKEQQKQMDQQQTAIQVLMERVNALENQYRWTRGR